MKQSRFAKLVIFSLATLLLSGCFFDDHGGHDHWDHHHDDGYHEGER